MTSPSHTAALRRRPVIADRGAVAVRIAPACAAPGAESRAACSGNKAQPPHLKTAGRTRSPDAAGPCDLDDAIDPAETRRRNGGAGSRARTVARRQAPRLDRRLLRPR